MAVGGNQIASLFVKLGADISEFERKMDRAASKVGSTGKAMQRTGMALTKAVTLPILAVAGVTAKAAIDFESAFAGVQKTVDATPEFFEKLRRGILDMNAELPASAKEIAGVMEAAGQLGIQNEALLSFTRTMIDLGETTNISANEAATSLARFANVMGTSQSEFSNLGSAIVDLGNNLETTEAEILQMAQRIAGAGKQIGLTEGEVLGFAAALSSVGIRADAGGTAISKVFIEIAKAVEKGGDKLRRFAGIAHLSIADFKETFEKDAAGATVRFIEGLGKVKDAGGSLFGVLDDLEIQERRMVEALLNTAGAGNKVRDSINLGNEAFSENTALVEEAAKRYATTESKIKAAAGQAQNAAIAIGDNLLGAIKAMLVPLRGMFEFLEKAAIAFGKLPLPIRVTVGAIVTMVAAIPVLVVALGSLARAFVAVKLAAEIMSVGIKRALISTGVGIAIVALGTLAAYVITEWEKVGPFFRRFWNDFVLLAATKVDLFLRIMQRMTVWQPVLNRTIALARKSLSGIIEEATIERGRMIYEENMRAVQKAIEEAGDAAEEAKLNKLLEELEDWDPSFDEAGDDVDKVAEALNALDGALKNITSRSVVFGSEVNRTAEKVGAFQEAVVALLDAGLSPADKRVIDLTKKIAALKQELADMPSGPELGVDAELEPVDLSGLFTGVEKLEVPFVRVLGNLVTEAQSRAEQVAAALEDGLGRATEAFAEGIGKMIAGGASFGDVMRGVMSTLADLAIRVGKIVVGFGVSVEAVKKALHSLQGGVAIAAGLALIALGSAVKSKLSSAASGATGSGGFGSESTSLTNFQPKIQRDNDRGFGRFGGSTGGGTRTDRFGERSGSQRRIVVEVNPAVLPSGDIEYSVREGTRRFDRQGTDEI